MTPVFICGFECGTLSAGHWASPNSSISTTTVRTGARSGRNNPSASVVYFSHNFLTADHFVCRVYVFFATLPNVDGGICYEGSTKGGAWFKASDSKIYAGSRRNVTPVFGATGISVTTGQWYRIDVHQDNSVSGVTVADVQVDGVACGQSTETVGVGTGGNELVLGNDLTNCTADYFYDDVILSATSGDYPIGAGYVNHFVPTSDGTHTTTTTITVKGTIAAPTGGGNVAGSTDVFNWVNGVPLLGGATDNTRLVNQQSNGSTLYTEVIFGPAPGVSTPIVAPRGVEVITAYRQAATGSGDFTVKLNDNGTENTIIASGAAAGVITDRYSTKQYATAPTGGAWGVSAGAGNFNNIRARFGYVADANPDQYWRGIMIEAEFAPLIASIPNKIYQINQAVNRANTY